MRKEMRPIPKGEAKKPLKAMRSKTELSDLPREPSFKSSNNPT
jgi:hypothetical protein